MGGLLTAAAYLVLLERWMAAWVQDRRGPNRVGIPLTNIKMFGLGQPLADGLKFIFKEEFTPSHVDKALFRLAPIVIMTAAVAIFAAIPFGSVLPPLGISGVQDPIPLLVAPNLDVGMVYIFALSSIAVYGVILGGWASNNKYSFLGALRSSAQLISYEIPLGLGLLGVVLFSGTLRLDAIIGQQANTGVWNMFLAAAGIFCVRDRGHGRSGAVAVRFARGRARTDRRLSHRIFRHEAAVVFDRRISAHDHGLVFDRDFVSRRLAFLGSDRRRANEVTWPIAILRIVVLAAKILAVILVFMIVRWSWPRFRFDQLMSLAWKVMVPLGLVNLVVAAVLVEYRQAIGRDLSAPSSLLGHRSSLSWGVTLAAWMMAGMLAPLSTDNTPRPIGIDPFDAEKASWRHEADDPHIKWIEEPKLGLSGRMYLPLFVQGLVDHGQAFV